MCLSISKVMANDNLELIDLLEIVSSFLIGCLITIFGFVFLQRRTLELLIQSTDTREGATHINSLIYNKKVYSDGPNIVVLGGGKGLEKVLKGLKKYTNNLTALVMLTDYNKKSPRGKIKTELPLDFVKDSLVALAEDEKEMSKFLNVELDGFRGKTFELGDALIDGMGEITGEFAKSIEKLNRVLKMKGRVLPITLDEITVCAELDDGTVIENKEDIPEVVSEKTGKINRIYLAPSNCRVAPESLKAIKNADAIIIAPGSLYTNVIPNLLVKGVAKAIRDSHAFKIYVSNILTEAGQTDNFSLSEHITAIKEHAGEGLINYVIYDTGEIIPEVLRRCNLSGMDLIDHDIDELKQMGLKLIQRDLSNVENKKVRHDSDKLAATIIELVCEDLKFRDKQNDAQYVLLNSKLKKKKRQIKKDSKGKIPYKAKAKTKTKTTSSRNNAGRRLASTGGRRAASTTRTNRQSKFFDKYDDRIKSIKESDRKAKEKSTRAK